MYKIHYLFFKKINGLSPRLLELESLYKIIYLKIKLIGPNISFHLYLSLFVCAMRILGYCQGKQGGLIWNKLS